MSPDPGIYVLAQPVIVALYVQTSILLTVSEEEVWQQMAASQEQHVVVQNMCKLHTIPS